MSAFALYTADVAALARKDLRLELRARDTLPAMLLLFIAVANPTLLYKVHRLSACAVTAAMLGPVLLVPWRDI